MDTEMITRNYMLYFLLPLWLIPGFLDWMCHLRTRIEDTSGFKESAIHQLQMATVGLPVLMGLFLEINSLIILIMIGSFLMHELASLWDVSYAKELRKVSAFEQHLHGYLNVLPFMALSFVICLHFDQFRALLGLGGTVAGFDLVLKTPMLPTPYLVTLISLFVLLLVVPYTEELIRCARASRRRAAASGGPSHSAAVRDLKSGATSA